MKYNPQLPYQTPAPAQPQNIVVNVANTASTGSDQLAARLKELHELKVSGALSEAEYDEQKQRLLSASSAQADHGL